MPEVPAASRFASLAPGAARASFARVSLHNRAPLQAALSVIPAALALYLVAGFPVVRPVLLAALLVYGLVCLLRPAFWLFAIPCLLPVLDLAPWSGRLYFQEIDAFLLMTAAACLWHGHYRPSRGSGIPLAFKASVGFYAISYCWSVYAGIAPLPALGPNAFSSYYSNYNALRIARGFCWALVLWPSLSLLFRRDRRLATVHLLAGVSAGLLATGVVALWERGALYDLLFGKDIYGRLDGLLDFTTPYRITGLLSSMHTGGEAIDGYLALAWPVALGLALYSRRRRAGLAFGMAALLAGLYCAVVTFSRASYLALGIGLACLTLAGVSVAARRTGPGSVLGGVCALLVFASLLAVAHRHGGLLALLAVMFAFGAPAIAAYSLRAGHELPAWGIACAVVPLATFVAHHAIATSKWVVTAQGAAWLLAAGTSAAATALGTFVGARAKRMFTPSEFIILTLLVAGISASVVPALLGYRMSFRFAGVSTDLETRFAHWRDALALMPQTLSASLHGVGLGVFPRRYLMAFPEHSGGIGVVEDEGVNRFMRLTGGKDLKWTQRIALPPDRDYTASLDYRTAAPAAELRLRVCRRQIIHPTEYNGQCRGVSQRISDTGGEWKTLSFSFNLGDLGTSPANLLRAPLVFELTNRREYALEFKPPAIVDVDNVRLIDASGINRLANGTFSHGIDRWFPLFDFNHLPWHIKNMAVALYFDQGLFGCLGFAVLTLIALGSAARAARAGDPAGLALATAILAFLGVGLVGTLVDEPRVMLLYFLYTFAAVAIGAAREAGKS